MCEINIVGGKVKNTDLLVLPKYFITIFKILYIIKECNFFGMKINVLTVGYVRIIITILNHHSISEKNLKT